MRESEALFSLYSNILEYYSLPNSNQSLVTP